MGGFEILDLVIGVIFVFFLLSLICVALQEIRARIFNLRVRTLKKWVIDNFNKDGKTLGAKLWNNFIIDGLTHDGKAASYIPKEIFVSALLNEIYYSQEHDKGKLEECKPPYDCDSLKDCIQNSTVLPIGLKRTLLQFHSESYNNLDHFRSHIEAWFESAMARNTGTYKKDAQKWILVFSIAVTIVINVDAVRLIKYFYENKDEAKRVADAAEHMIKDPKTIAYLTHLDTLTKYDSTLDQNATIKANVDSIKNELKKITQYHNELIALGLPIGWMNVPDFSKEENPYAPLLFLLRTLIGWFITAIAVSLGAPFWFDMLNKLVDLRSAGKRPKSAAEKNDKESTDAPENAIG